MYRSEELKNILENCTYDEFIEYKELLIKDERKIIHNIIQRCENRFLKLQKEIDENNKRMIYELELYKNGVSSIAGIDEVGRGPLAGPVFAAAVILDKKITILGVKDSKKLSSKQREQLSEEIKLKCIEFSIGTASAREIDSLNILNATKLAMKRAVDGLKHQPEHLLIDAVNIENVNIKQTPIIKGDDLSISIGAASIIAKVARDKYMDELSEKYPQFLFDKNKGYGTMEHINAIKEYGICEAHRRTFVKNFI